MAGVKALRKIQMGDEVAAGTAIAASAIWRGTGTIEDRRRTEFVEEDVGYLGRTDRSYVPELLAAISFDDIEATFEQLPYILEAGVKDETPAQDGAGSGYIYEYALPTTAAATIQTYTIEGGDDQQAEEMEYAFVESFKLSGKAKGGVMMQADWLGRQIAKTTFTALISLPTVEEILFGKGKLYIDAAGGSFGGTQKSSTLLGFDLKVKTGWQPVFTGDGSLYFTFNKATAPEITLDITFEHDSTAVAEKDAWIAETARLIRLEFEGSELATSGVYTYKTLFIDLAGKWETFDKLGEQDGNDIVTGTFRSKYNATADDWGQFTVVNELTTLP